MTVVVDSNGVAEQPGPNRLVIEKWVTALESGEYQQTKGTLHRTEDNGYGEPGFCCLGVLCDLAVKDGIIPAPVILEKIAVYAGQDATLPEAVWAWAGLPTENPDVNYIRSPEEIDREWEDTYDYYLSKDDVPVEDRTDLAELNDSNGRNFQDIAQIIRDNYL